VVIWYESLFGGHDTSGVRPGNATVVLYLGVIYAVQRVVLRGRAQRGAIQAMLPPASGGCSAISASAGCQPGRGTGMGGGAAV
jgi:hypothetical protein